MRTVFLWLHQIVGLTLGLILLVQGLSGSVLVWRPEIDRLLLPELTHQPHPGPRLSLDAELAAVRKAMPDAQLRMVRLTDSDDGADEWGVTLAAPASLPNQGPDTSRRTIYIAPASAQVLGIRGEHKDTLTFLVELHHSLLIGRTGRNVLGYMAIATILLALSGLWLWWPDRWMPSRFRPRATARPLHFAMGFWAMWPLLAIAISALYFVWRQPIQMALGVGVPQSGPKRLRDDSARHDQHNHRSPAVSSLDVVVTAAQQALTGDRIAALRFPERSGDEITVLGAGNGEHYRALPDSASVRIAPDGTAHVEGTQRWSQLPARRRMLDWLPRIHQAEVGGLPVRLLWTATGWMPLTLYWSGFLMWRRRLRR